MYFSSEIDEQISDYFTSFLKFGCHKCTLIINCLSDTCRAFRTSYFACDVAYDIITFSYFISDIELKFKFTYLRKFDFVHTFKFTYLRKFKLIFKFKLICIKLIFFMHTGPED